MHWDGVIAPRGNLAGILHIHALIVVAFNLDAIHAEGKVSLRMRTMPAGAVATFSVSAIGTID